MKAQLEETTDAAREEELLPGDLMPEDALRRGEDYLRLTIEDRQRAETLLAGENQILEMVATGRPLAVILDGLCRLVDKLCDKSMASILLIDPSGRCLRRGAGQLSRSVHGCGGWRRDRSLCGFVRNGRLPQRASHRL